jgi:glycosyltransferase involved in cell wall biosynthesis
MTSGPLFSVIIPTFNRADLLLDAVTSVLEQTFRDFEIVVVDDGSTDETRSLLRPYDDRIRYFYQENAGVSAARNRGIAESRGKYLAFLDSDDLFAPRMLEEAKRTFARHPEAGAVFTAEVDLDSRGRPGRVVTKKSPGIFFTPPGMISIDTRIGSGRPGIVRREWVERLGGFDESLGCAIDCDLWIRYSFHMQMVLQPEPLVFRRWHAGNLVSDLRQDAEDWLHILDKVAAEHPEFLRDHPRVYRRTQAKENMRYGRELLSSASHDDRRLARRVLIRAARLRPLRIKTWVYLACSYLVPASVFGRWRSWEYKNLDSDGRKAHSTAPKAAND